MKYRFLILILPAALLCQFSCRRDYAAKKQPQAVRGLLDLRSWDFSRDGSVNLDGQWAFYWKRLLPKTPVEKPDVYASVPRPWKGLSVGGNTLQGEGFATYHLRVLLSEKVTAKSEDGPGESRVRFLALELGDINTAYRLFVNERLVHSVGIVGRDAISTRPAFRPDIVPIAVAPRLDIVVQIANFHHRKGGLDHVVRLGLEKPIRAGHEAANNISLFVFGSLLFLGLYHFILFVLRPADLRPLDLALVCLVLGIRNLATGNYYLMRLFPELEFSLLLKIEYLTLFLTIPIFSQFVYSLFRLDYPVLVLRFFQILGYGMSLFVVFTDVQLFSQWLIFYFIGTGAFIAHAFTTAVLAFKRKRDGAGYVLIGGFVFGIMAVLDILNNQYVLRFLPDSSPYGLLFFVSIHSFLLARGSARAFVTAEKLSADLEDRVGARTRELEASHNAIRLSEQKYRSLVETSGDLIWSLDSRGRLTFINQAAVKIYGYDPEELLGRGLVELSAPEFKARDAEVVEAILRGRSYFHYETVHLHRDGRPIQMSFNAIFMYDEQGSIIGATGTATDITEYKRVLEELEGARDAAEKANRAKSEFLATMSHEIRTPLNSIIGTANLLRDTSANVEQERYIELLNRAGKNLLHQINDILDISRIEAGKMEMENIGFSLEDLLESITSIMRVRAEQKGLSIELIKEENLPARVAGDPARLEQILLNLLGNAVKFTQSGRIRLIVKMARDSMSGVLLRFAVEDTGIGIPAEKLPRIFESFSQVDSSTTRQYGGTGLGLSISRQLVHLMGGRMWAHSNGGSSSAAKGEAFIASVPRDTGTEGSIFYFTALFGRVDAVGVFAPSDVDPASRDKTVLRSDLRILLVEDNPDNLFLFERYLEKAGIELETAENGEVAVAKAEKDEFDLILMDIQMPVMDGYRAAELIRENEKNEGREPVPILALTANATRADMEKTRRMGFNEHVSKPVSRANLISAIARATNGSAP